MCRRNRASHGQAAFQIGMFKHLVGHRYIDFRTLRLEDRWNEHFPTKFPDLSELHAALLYGVLYAARPNPALIDPDPPFHRRAARSTLDPTWAKPPPWFVGGGKGVVAVVLSICAILLIARGVTMWWLVEDWWAWWNAPFSMERAASAPPERRVPAANLALASRGPRGNPGLAFGADAYPAEAIRAGQQGRTVAKLTVDASGTPIRCTVTTSGGSRALDRATCGTTLARVRFEPARDDRGAPISSEFTLPVRWVLPES